jgi:Uma2 family endonuclease
MTTSDAIRRGYYTCEDLAETPDDGQRYEVIEGRLVVTPPAAVKHGETAQRLCTQLQNQSPAGLRAVAAGIGIQIDTDSAVPVVVVYHAGEYGEWLPADQVLIVVEVNSPRTWRYDWGTKRDLYARAGIPYYWIVDRQGELHVLELHHQGYQEIARGTRVRLERPFAATISSIEPPPPPPAESTEAE